MKKETGFAIVDEFYGKYDALVERDNFIKEAKEKIIKLCGGEDSEMYYEVANTLQDLTVSCGTVGYIIGVSDGVRLVKELNSPDFAERFLSIIGEII